MATFPTGIADALHSPSTNDTIAATDVSALVTEILAIEAKVGKDTSDVPSSHDWLLEHLPPQANNRDLGEVEIRAQTFNADTTSAIPLVLASGCLKCTYLDADLVDGKHVAGTNGAGEITTNDGTQTLTNKTLTSPTINGGAFTGGTDIAVADGGTGASTAADARTNLGLGTIATQAASSVAITGGSVTGITDIAVADGGTGASTAAGARTALGLNTMAEQAAGAVAITGGTITGITNLTATGGSITGITDLAVADGGTGSSTAAAARTALGVAAANPLGAWVDKSASYAAQQAATDGFVCVEFTVTDGGNLRYSLDGYTDGNADPTTVRSRAFEGQRSWGSATVYGGFTMPVKKSDYWKVVRTVSGTPSSETLKVYWIPLGS